MADVLSQSQIDALLKSMQNPSPEPAASTASSGPVEDSAWRIKGIGLGDSSQEVETIFGHPTQEAMDRMTGAGMALRRTDEEGNILIQVGK